MSLNRAEWLALLESCNQLQKIANRLHQSTEICAAKMIDAEVQFIKNQIQSVIGQME